MCGRFALFASPEEIAGFFGLPAPPDPYAPRYNIAPTQPITAVRLTSAGERELTFFQWGLVPSWAKDPAIGSRMINARSETVAEKPSFRAAFKRRRCLIPASGFYEWQKQNGRKQPHFIHPTGASLFALAGLWEQWRDGEGSTLQTCTILTTRPNELVEPLHNRMPVIVAPQDFNHWLDPGPRPEDAHHLLRPYAPGEMDAYPVSTEVNNPRNDTSTCVEPLS